MERNSESILLILFILIVIIFGCQKDDADYLNKYTGFFTFTIKRQHRIWFSNYDTAYTITFDGQISKYSGDLNNAYRRLKIDFGNTIEPEVLEGGAFVTERRGGADYYLLGHFLNSDEVTFEFKQESAGFYMLDNVTGRRR
jgi:hypothetical protein